MRFSSLRVGRRGETQKQYETHGRSFAAALILQRVPSTAGFIFLLMLLFLSGIEVCVCVCGVCLAGQDAHLLDLTLE